MQGTGLNKKCYCSLAWYWFVGSTSQYIRRILKQRRGGFVLLCIQPEGIIANSRPASYMIMAQNTLSSPQDFFEDSTECWRVQVISTARTCNLILIVLDCLKPISHKKLIEHELEGFGIRLNKQPPNLTFRKKDKGGITFTSAIQNPKLDLEGTVTIHSLNVLMPVSGQCWRRYRPGKHLPMSSS